MMISFVGNRHFLCIIEEERVSVGYVLRNMMTIGLVVAVMYHFIVK